MESEGAPARTARRKVLVVDDSLWIHMFVKKALAPLAEEGVELLFAQNGHDALDLVRRESPDVVLLDIVMAGKDGFDVCRTIKKRWKRTDIIVIMLSVKGLRSDIERAMEEGADDFLTKPFAPPALLGRVREALMSGSASESEEE